MAGRPQGVALIAQLWPAFPELVVDGALGLADGVRAVDVSQEEGRLSLVEAKQRPAQ